jgi:hypothetical protein
VVAVWQLQKLVNLRTYVHMRCCITKHCMLGSCPLEVLELNSLA